MIKNIFAPATIKNFYLFPKRIIGFDIGKTHISATQIYLKGKTTLIEKFFEEKLELNAGAHYQEKAGKAIQTILGHAGRFDAIYTSLPSSVVIFKELKLPFLSYEKIHKVISYEAEPLLPFPLSDATLDFIITKQNQEEGSSELLVAAVQNQHIVQHLQLFEAAGVSPEIITVDFFALYGLYKRIPEYAQQEGNVILVDLGLHSTRIAFIQDGQLRFVRTLTKGTFHLTKGVSEALRMQPNETMEHIVRFGLEKADDQTYMQAITQALTGFWSEIQFTIDSFTKQTEPKQQIKKIVLLGGGAEIKGLATFITERLQLPCELFQATKIVNGTTIFSKQKTIPSANIISLSTALPGPETAMFNLRTGVFAISDSSLFTKQIVTSLTLLFLLLLILFAHTFWQKRKFQQELSSSKQETLKLLKEKFPKIPRSENKVDDVIRSAQDEVTKTEEMWFAFSTRARSSSLKYLLELTNIIDQEGLGFNLEKIVIIPGEGKMAITAHIKDYDALKRFEQELSKSKLLSSYEPQDQFADFTMNITLPKSIEGD